MGMSIDQGPNIDLAMILAGGDDFKKRIETYTEAKAALEAAQADLQLGKDARAAYAEAKKLIEDGKAQVAAMIQAAEAKMAEAEASVARAAEAKRKIKAEIEALGALVIKAGKDHGVPLP
jgi:hypothetical protein